MERFCSKCGNLVTGDGKFCPQCGAEMESAVNLDKPVSDPVPENPYVQPPIQPQQPAGYSSTSNYAAMPNYPQSANVNNSVNGAEMTTKQWVGTIVLTTFFGLISIILCFVWAFSDGNETRKRYCRGMLIAQAIMLGVIILFYIIFFGALFGCAAGLSGLDSYYYY